MGFALQALMTTQPQLLAARLHALAEEGERACGAAAILEMLVREGLADLPLPGTGQTRRRWQSLAAVAAHDLSLAKLYEGHTDAVAILAAIGVAAAPETTYGMWAAEPPDVRLVGRREPADRVRLDGTKAWCSGAGAVDRGLLTFRDQEGVGPWLADVDMHQPGIDCDDSAWRAIGMAGSASANVRFDSIQASVLGTANFYLERPGFWQGGVGIAACWHGATCAVAEALLRSARATADPGWHRLLGLGKIDCLLSANAALLREAADWIDAHPHTSARRWALRTRAATDQAAQDVLALVTRAMGAAPLCRDADFARRAADLPVFIRQCHGDRDLASLGEHVLADQETSWML